MTKRIDTEARIERVRLDDQSSVFAGDPTSGYSWLYTTTGSSPHGGLFLEKEDGSIIGPFITGTSSSGGYTEGARVYRNTGTAITNGVVETIVFNSEVYDTDNNHSGASSQLYCNTVGKYIILFQGVWDFTPTDSTNDAIWIEHNSRGRISQSGINGIRSATLSTVIDLAIDDYVVVKMYSNNISGNLIYISPNEYSPFFEMQRIG
jgi:hypothetical protein